jgi:hypothetical protein
MNLFSQYIIRGTAHDDSARDPPPRCHPGTRIKLVARVTAWFNGEAQEELLLWITGPASIGKSAVGQKFAEYLSRPNRCRERDRATPEKFSFVLFSILTITRYLSSYFVLLYLGFPRDGMTHRSYQVRQIASDATSALY